MNYGRFLHESAELHSIGDCTVQAASQTLRVCTDWCMCRGLALMALFVNSQRLTNSCSTFKLLEV